MDWNSVFGLHTLGKELLQQRLYTEAEPYFLKALEKDRNLRYQTAADLRTDPSLVRP